MFRLVPPAIHRAMMPLAYRMRHNWRKWRKKPLQGCNIIITDFGDDVLLLRHSYGPKGWALPGGGVKRNEDLTFAAQREVREELAMEIASLKLIGTVEEEFSGSPHTSHVFTAVADEHPTPDGREVIEARFFPRHSLPEPLSKITRQRLEMWTRSIGQKS